MSLADFWATLFSIETYLFFQVAYGGIIPAIPKSSLLTAAGMRAVVVAASLGGPSGTSVQSLFTCEHRLQVSQSRIV